jgi:predicted AlkP superfamily phosphohydrolase/phosphomutase
MAVTRVVFLGIDGLDWEFIERNLQDLPTLSRLSVDATVRPLESIFPPDSIPAWTTIFTGVGPAEHGVVESIDYLSNKPAEAVEGASSLLRGRTFWDRASEAGRTVCVVNAFMAFPAWPVNGLMLSGPVFVDSDQPSVYPADLLDELGRVPQLGGIVDFPSERTMASFIESTMRTTEGQAAFGLSLLHERRPDLFFLNILTIDRLQHFAWRFCDPGDPTYPGPNKHSDSILNAYRAVDGIVARYVEAAGDDAVVIVASDHGFGRRCTRMLFVDELMRRSGLVSAGSVPAQMRALVLEKTKRFMLSTAARLAIEEPAYALARRVPGRKRLKTSSYAVSGASLVRPSRLFGRNASGGIKLSAEIGESERTRLATRIIGILEALRDRDGESVVAWARRREDVLSGQHLERFPDVLFELHDGYGVDFGIFGPLFAPDPMHRRISGGHKKTGVFIASCPPTALPHAPGSIGELYQTVLGLLDVA